PPAESLREDRICIWRLAVRSTPRNVMVGPHQQNVLPVDSFQAGLVELQNRQRYLSSRCRLDKVRQIASAEINQLEILAKSIVERRSILEKRAGQAGPGCCRRLVDNGIKPKGS